MIKIKGFNSDYGAPNIKKQWSDMVGLEVFCAMRSMVLIRIADALMRMVLNEDG